MPLTYYVAISIKKKLDYFEHVRGIDHKISDCQETSFFVIIPSTKGKG